MKILSGGQTGVDRAALDAAIDHGIDCGGWCPVGRKAEDGVIPDSYPLTELPGAGYRQRTKQNVLDSDGTVIIYFEYLTGGTEQTVRFCMTEKRPYLLIDASELTKQRAAHRIAAFVTKISAEKLNVAGPRGSGHPEAYRYTYDTLTKYIEGNQSSKTG